MLLIEKVLLLKACEIFKDTPEQDLIDTAALLEELEMDKDTLIFSKGDIGNCMYLIYKGKVRIHEQEHTYAILGENDLFGELSLLDTETRSASATCQEDCYLLKLDQEPFYEMLSANNNVLKGILRTLSQRIRRLDEKINPGK
jgi:CRP/FNR family transcriptional regulator, cyclic AMP receptor protein